MKKYLLTNGSDSAYYFQIEENEMVSTDGKSYIYYLGERKALSVRQESIVNLLIVGKSYSRDELFDELVKQEIYRYDDRIENVSDVMQRLKKNLPDGMLAMNPYYITWTIKEVRGIFSKEAVNIIHDAINDSITSLFDAIDGLEGKEF